MPMDGQPRYLCVSLINSRFDVEANFRRHQNEAHFLRDSSSNDGLLNSAFACINVLSIISIPLLMQTNLSLKTPTKGDFLWD